MASVRGKVIAVTGAASGIGLAVATLLLSRGAKVAAADVKADIHDILKKVPGADETSVMSSVVDVRKVDSVQNWIDDIIKKFGGLDEAANMAGVYKAWDNRGVELEDEQNWNFMLDVNLTGVMHCMRAQLARMNSGGSVVNCASILSIRGSAGAAAYSASKHGVVGSQSGVPILMELPWTEFSRPLEMSLILLSCRSG